jgi:hypothetical protein
VYLDASVKKIRSEFGVLRGRAPANLRTRPDISVWYKSDADLRAIIEIKHAWNLAPIKLDAKKVEKYVRQSGAAGYILAYSEAEGTNNCEILENRFEKWAQSISWRVRDVRTGTSDLDDWGWGIGLLRCD